MFRKSLESGTFFLWLFYGLGTVGILGSIWALLTGRLDLWSKEDSYSIMVLAVGPATILSIFFAAHLPYLLERRRMKKAGK